MRAELKVFKGDFTPGAEVLGRGAANHAARTAGSEGNTESNSPKRLQPGSVLVRRCGAKLLM